MRKSTDAFDFVKFTGILRRRDADTVINSKDYPDGFLRYALSGKAKCHACERIIVAGQTVYEYKGNVFHDICSEKLEGRNKLS